MLSLPIRPALSSGRREAAMVAAGRVQLALVDDAGLTRYVKVEAKVKSPTGGYERGTTLLEDATHVFVSEKGYGTARIGTYYPRKGAFYAADRAADSHVEAFRAVVAYVNGDDLPAPFVAITAEDKCGLCGQPLRDPVSVDRGIGPECAAKPTGTRVLAPVPSAAPVAPAAPAPVQVSMPHTVSAQAPIPASTTRPQTQLVPPMAQGERRHYLDLSDKKLAEVLASAESIVAELKREQDKREFARREAAQETIAAIAGMN